MADYPPPPGALTLDSLRTGLVVIGVVAVAALGLAIWALLRRDSDRGGPSSTPATKALNGRVDRLDAEVHALRTGSARATSIGSLRARIASLDRTVKRVSGHAAGAASAQQVSQLSRRVDTLSSQVTQLKTTLTRTSTQTTTLTTTSR